MMDIINLIPRGQANAVTRRELCELTGWNDRKVREAIFQARRDHLILNLQDGNGYFRPTEDESHLVKRFYEQEMKRLKSIGWALKPAREWLYG